MLDAQSLLKKKKWFRGDRGPFFFVVFNCAEWQFCFASFDQEYTNISTQYKILFLSWRRRLAAQPQRLA